jgi:hypothetical protein
MKEIELSKQGWKNKGKYVAYVDDEIFEEVNKYGWSYSNDGYASRTDRSTGKEKHISLHCYIWNLKFGDIPSGLEVEHKDRNRLNCQISNLRLATRAENCRNKSKTKRNSSGYVGVSKEICKKEKEDGIHIHKYWQCSWTDNFGIGRSKSFPFNNAGKVLAGRYYDLKTSQVAGEYHGELNFNSLEEFQNVLQNAILEDIESN